VVIGPHEVVRPRLARRVGAVGLVPMVLGEGRCIGGQRPVDLVGGDMQESEGRPLRPVQARPVAPRCLQEPEGPHHIRLDEGLGPMDRAVHMGLGREVHDRPRAVLGEQPGHQRRVPDIPLREGVPRVPIERGQIPAVPGIRQQVEGHDRFAGLGEPVQDEVAADESRPA